MIMDTIKDHKLIKRTIRMAELAFVHRDTGELFVPLLDEVWFNKRSGKMVRILSNRRHRFNVKNPYFRDYWHPVTLTWSRLFSHDPITMLPVSSQGGF